MKKLLLVPLSFLTFLSCSKENNQPSDNQDPFPKPSVTVSFEQCEIPSNTTNNIPANGQENKYEEQGVQFVCVNKSYELSGIWVSKESKKSDWDQEFGGVPSDRCVICNDEEKPFTGADNTVQYSVWAYSPRNSDILPQMSFAEGVEKQILAVKVNNVAKWWHVIKAGYYSKPGFAEGDYYEVIFTGYDVDGKETGKVPVIMADYRDGKQFIMGEWTKVDFSALGEVNKVVLTATPCDKLDDAMYGEFYSVCVDEIEIAE